MFRPITAAVLSIALALPLSTAPARADAEDVAKVLGGLATLYILKEALDRDNRVTVTRQAPARQHQVHRPHRPRHTTQPRHNRARVIPGQCLVNHTTRRGVVTGYGARCMQRWAARPNLLPARCERDVYTHRGWRKIYAPRCLQRQGWTTRTARR